MGKEKLNNFKLGLLIAGSLTILIISLYLVGKNRNLFGSNFNVRARFSNINGLVKGNNVRYSGIQAGTVSHIQVLNDSTIEVSLSIDKAMKPFIHINSLASIGSDGIIGNKVIEIVQNKEAAPQMPENGLLITDRVSGTDQMMKTLSNTSNNIETLSQKLIVTVDQLNNSNALWQLLNDTTIPANFRISLNNLGAATTRINDMSVILNNMVLDIQNGKGTLGLLLNDKATAENTKQAIENINKASAQSNQVLENINTLVTELKHDISNGPGAAHLLLNDTAFAGRTNRSMKNIEKGTEAFSEDMEALKHNILLRRYFRKQAKKDKK